MFRDFLLCLLVFGLASQAGATDTALRRLDTGDDNRGWEAVGRLDIGGRGFCTGALIAPDLVLTAAHCLFDKITGTRIDHRQIEFRAGWRNGRAEAYRDVSRAVVHPDYDFDGSVAVDRVRNDLALLELRQPIRTTAVRPFDTDSGAAGEDRVGVVSYAHDRPDAPSLQQMCGVIGQQDGVLVMSCDVDFGSSGAPIFSFSNGEARIVSVVSAKAELEGRPVALGTDLTGPLSVLRAELDAGKGWFLDGMSEGGQFVPSTERRETGAKFLKP